MYIVVYENDEFVVRNLDDFGINLINKNYTHIYINVLMTFYYSYDDKTCVMFRMMYDGMDIRLFTDNNNRSTQLFTYKVYKGELLSLITDLNTDIIKLCKNEEVNMQLLTIRYNEIIALMHKLVPFIISSYENTLKNEELFLYNHTKNANN